MMGGPWEVPAERILAFASWSQADKLILTRLMAIGGRAIEQCRCDDDGQRTVGSRSR